MYEYKQAGERCKMEKKKEYVEKKRIKGKGKGIRKKEKKKVSRNQRWHVSDSVPIALMNNLHISSDKPTTGLILKVTGDSPSKGRVVCGPGQ